MHGTWLRALCTAAMLLAAFAGAPAGASPDAGTSPEPVQRARLPGGEFIPVLRPTPPPGPSSVRVAAFELDRLPVSNAEFLLFVRAHPEWRRDRVPSLLADSGYLAHWSEPDALGAQALPAQPVTQVSWFAARAYCEARGERLPDWYEWEYAAAADERLADARAQPGWRSRILDWYARPATAPLASVGQQAADVHGVQDLHGLIWEWVEDFGALTVSGDSRSQGDPDRVAFCGGGAATVQDRENYPMLMRVALLSSLEGRSTGRLLGFRCAASVSP